MPRSNRAQRRQVGETDETSGIAAARGVAAEQGENQTQGNAANAGNAENRNPAGNVEAPIQGLAAAVELSAVLAMLAQVLERLPAVAAPPPVANVPPVVPPVVEVADANVRGRIPSYLKVLDHMQKLGTKFFAGGTKPVEADEWRERLERNFESIRCPDEYKKDIAIHYLEGDAHIWWRGVSARLGTPDISWESFGEEFKLKYFPPEAYDRLEGAFLDLRQGTMTVREYEAEFNRLKKYGGHELEDEGVQVRRFMRGLRIELRNRCLVRNYATVAELVEKAAMLESGMAEEAKFRGKDVQIVAASSVKFCGQRKKVWGKQTSSGKSPAGCSVCLACGKIACWVHADMFMEHAIDVVA